MAGPRQEAGGLCQQRRFADAGIAADQQHRAFDKTAAGDAIQFSHSRGEARDLVALAGEGFQREQPALALGADGDRHRGRAGYVLLDQRIPLAAGFALALPAIIRRTAILADEGEGVFGHEGGESLLASVAALHSMETSAASMVPSLTELTCRAG